MADYFLQGFGSMLPDNHPARADLMQAPRLGKEKHTGLVAYELAELAVDWLQELVGEEGGDKKLLDNLPAPNVDLEGRRRRLLHARATGPLSQEAAGYPFLAKPGPTALLLLSKSGTLDRHAVASLNCCK